MTKKKKIKFRKRYLVLFIIICLILGSIFLIFLKYKSKEIPVFNFSTLNTIGYDNKTIKYINEKLTEDEIKDLESKEKIDNLELFISKKYYLHKNLDRYLNYFTTHPELNIDKIIALVNVNADTEGYSNSKKADLSKGILILVNKYNKLDDSYEPTPMVDISTSYAYAERRILKEVYDSFLEMYLAAKKEKIDLFVVSAYRSFSYQKNLYTNYIGMYGVDYANTVSAKPGYSEHQTGLAMDITTPDCQMSEFKNTNAYVWLKDNSYKYGFILRYPEDKTDITGYAFESWHYRYLGKYMAKKVFEEGLTYDEYYAFYLDN